MSGHDGRGPACEGPMTGRGNGYCVLTTSKENPEQVKGFAGLEGTPVGKIDGDFETIRKKVINMPRGDGTGPDGMGPMTGRSAGFCVDHQVPGNANPIGGHRYWGRGRGQGGGRGWRHWFHATGLPGWARANFGYSGPVAPTVTAEQELAELKQQAEFLQNNLGQISERIEQLEKENSK